MDDNGGCAVVIIAFMLIGALLLAWLSNKHYDGFMEATCVERGGYYVKGGLTIAGTLRRCIEPPVPVNIAPKARKD